MRLRGIAGVLGVPLAEIFAPDGQLGAVPPTPMAKDEIQAAVAFKAIPAERRPWALKVLKALGGR